MLPDWSAKGLAAQVNFLKSTIRDAKAFTGLTPKEQFERDYLVHVAEGQLFFIEDADFPHRNPAFYVGGLDPNVYIARPYAEAATRMKAFVKYAQNVPAAAAQIKRNIKLPLPETFVKYGQAGVRRVRGLLYRRRQDRLCRGQGPRAAGRVRRRHRQGVGRDEGPQRLYRVQARDQGRLFPRRGEFLQDDPDQ